MVGLPSAFRRFFFFRICGTGMGAVACLLKEKGHVVEGADKFFAPPMGDYLKSTGIPCHPLEKITSDGLKKFDLIVVGNVVAKGSEEAKLIERSGVPCLSFPMVLGRFVLSGDDEIRQVVGVAGTHGKTTTTYLMAQLFENLGESPSYLIGGVMEGRPSSRLGDGKYFFIESDEYDSAYFDKISKFRHYGLQHLILTSLEFDHGDIFQDIEAIKDQFRAVIPQIPGTFIVNTDYLAVADLCRQFKQFKQFKHVGGLKRRWITYGKHSSTGPRIEIAHEGGTSFHLDIDSVPYGFTTNLVGEQNIFNLSACILFAATQGWCPFEIQKAVGQLDLPKRRQEVKGTYRGALVIDDFAHHPHAVQMTIEAIKIRYPKKKLAIILEPASATARSAVFQKEFEQVLNLTLSDADSVILIRPSKPTTVKNIENLDCLKIAEALKDKGTFSQVISRLDDLRSAMKKKAREDTLLLILSNGTCLGLWESDFVNELEFQK